MKCRLIREMEQRNPKFDPDAARIARQSRVPYPVRETVWSPAGTEIEHPEAWRLPLMGVAEPVDEECKNAVNAALERRRLPALTPEALAERAAKYERLNSGRATGDKQFDAASAATATAEADDE